jgi:hypothetical protein
MLIYAVSLSNSFQTPIDRRFSLIMGQVQLNLTLLT